LTGPHSGAVDYILGLNKISVLQKYTFGDT
jgi:hypothetical protein